MSQPEQDTEQQAATASGVSESGAAAPGHAGEAGPAAPASDLSVLHQAYSLPTFLRRKVTHHDLWTILGSIADDAPAIRRAEIGASVEGRPLYSVTFGDGPTTVLLWSQMHGDESSHTMALADLVAYWAREPEDPRVRKLCDALTVVAVPMLNPDGAERFVRLNAQGIDMNRDAKAWLTPELRALRDLFHRIEPEFALSLHDQSVRKRVGESDRITALALLANPENEEGKDTDVTIRAKRIAGVIRDAVEPLVPGRVARFPFEYDPKGMGEYMARHGTSTVLLECGFLPNDLEKQGLRAVSFVANLSALEAMADRSYEAVPVDRYESLEENDPDVYDLLIRGDTLVVPGLPPYRADIGVEFDAPLDLRDGKLAQIGDLSDTAARETIDASGLFIHPDEEALSNGAVGAAVLSDGNPASMVIRDGEDPGSRAVYRIKEGFVKEWWDPAEEEAAKN